MPDGRGLDIPGVDALTDEPLAPTARFLELCAEASIEFDEGDVERLGLFLARLLQVNTIMNLTAIRDPEAAWERHIFDALTLLPVIGEVAGGGNASLIDVGSGGGVPGIPIALTCPELRVTLLEATGKKAAFLKAAGAELSNLRVLSDRAERVGTHAKTGSRDGQERGRHELVTARALGRIVVAAELCVPLAKVGGLIVLVKGQGADEELREAEKALDILRAQHVETIDTPTGRVVVLEKVAPTPKDYPRRDGVPKQSPLV